MTHTKEDLKMMQALPLSIKVRMTEERIRQWYQYWGGKVCVSFSGGKDSTVLMHIARGLYPDIPAVFSNTGLEYPEIQQFVRNYGDVDIVTPAMRFTDVVTEYGYPLIGKEVAEAIYYARRIRSQTVQVERERERERERENSEAKANRTMREAERRRGNLTGAERSNAGSTLWGNVRDAEQQQRNGELSFSDSESMQSNGLEIGTSRMVEIQEREKRQAYSARTPKWGDFYRKVFNIEKSDPRTKDICYNWRRGCL